MSKERGESFLFEVEQRDLLTGVLDEIVPCSDDGALPGAGELGVAQSLEQTLEQRPELGPLVAHGLSAIDTLARSRNPAGFAALSKPDRLSVLREIEGREPAFFGTLFLCTYLGYYTHRRVVERLGLRPHPQPDGYELEAGDLDVLLQKVRARSAKLYRSA
jgi:hypothetical protein